MVFVTMLLHLQASADAALSCKPVRPITVRLHDAPNVGSNVGSKHLGQYGANVGANVGGAGCQLHDASNSPPLEGNIQQ